MPAAVLVLALAFAALVAPAFANGFPESKGPRLYCKGEMTGDFGGDVFVKDMGTCYIRDGVTIGGSVFMKNKSHLVTTGKVEIKGPHGILGIEAGSIDSRGGLIVEKIDMFNGTAEDNSITIHDGFVGNGGLKLEASNGSMILCGTTVNDVLEYKECKGKLEAWQSWLHWLTGYFGCAKNTFTKDTKIEAIDGDVSIVGTDVPSGELNIKSTIGKVTVKYAKIKVAKLELNMGGMLIDKVQAGESEIKENIGGVGIYNSDFAKLNCIDNAPGVEGWGNDFGIVNGQCANEELAE